MRKSRALTGLLAVGAVSIASLFAASPAGAATLPAGQQITVIDTYLDFYTYYNANPETAVLAAVGSGDDIDEFTTAVDVDDTGHGYALSNWEGEGEGSVLYVADAVDGTLTDPLDVLLDDGETPVDSCTAIDYTGGIIQAICFKDVEGTDVQYWGIIDPATGFLTPLYQFDGDEYLDLDSLAIDPISGLVYAIGYPDGAMLYTLSEDAGATPVIGVDEDVFEMDFDRSGQLWVTSADVYEPDEGEPYLASVLGVLDVSTGAFPFFEFMRFDASGTPFGNPVVEPITVWGTAPVLPATGPAEPSVPLVAAALLLLAGTILAGVTALRRRRLEAL